MVYCVDHILFQISGITLETSELLSFDCISSTSKHPFGLLFLNNYTKYIDTYTIFIPGPSLTFSFEVSTFMARVIH